MINSNEPPCTTARLRLLVVTSLFPPAAGGAAEAFRTLSEAWEQEDSVEQILILCERRKDSPTHETRGKTLVRRILPARDSRPKPNPVRHVILAVATYALMACLIVWYVRWQRWPLVLVHGRFGRKGFLRILKLCGAKVVVYVSGHLPPPRRFANCDAAVCVTESVYERAVRQLPKSCRVHYVPLAFELPRPVERQVAAQAGAPYFLFLGAIGREKGADVLLEAFAAFRQQHPEYRLLLAGPVRDSFLPGMAGPGTMFLGPADRMKVTALIQHAEALVLPSHSEGLPRVCMEAIALGTKVICPPGVPELLRACPDWVLPAITVRDVLEKLQQAVSSPFRASFDFASHDPKIVGSQILAVCAAVLQEQPEVQSQRPKSETLRDGLDGV